ncbi:MAG: hypothetical protein H6617_10600 [Bdellovibrionaceae bacterium]|nr:hypothetical protein [Bdellovibrionales bacterium]MCB9255120.1 hypothetical protein [Pseudobdellovibrionaceae bacterium]
MPSLGNFRFRLYGLVALQLITALSAVALLERMAPAMRLILSENVYSLEASEDMLAVLASPGKTLDAERFDEAFVRARKNTTEPAEVPLLDTIEKVKASALAGDVSARVTVVRSILELADVNRAAMYERDRTAQRLGLGGSWAVVVLGLFGLAFGIIVIKSITTQLILPVQELTQVLLDWRRGDFRRRCTLGAKSGDLTHAMKTVNQLLDER